MIRSQRQVELAIRKGASLGHGGFSGFFLFYPDGTKHPVLPDLVMSMIERSLLIGVPSPDYAGGVTYSLVK